MTVVYELEGNLIRKVERTVSEVGRVSDMLPTLMTYHPIEMGRLPKDTVYLKIVPAAQDQTRVTARIIVQQPPQVRDVLFNESHGAPETQQQYKLAMPYFNFWFEMSGSPIRANGEPAGFIWAPISWGIFWTRTPFATTADEAVSAKMPNSWGDTRVCFGNNPITANVTLGAHIDMLINTYWTSVFNTDLDVYTPYGGRHRTQLARWQTATESNNDVWMTWDFWTAGDTRPITELIAHVASPEAFMQPAPDSTEPVVPRPPVERTWFAINQWVQDSLNETQRERLLSALQPSG